MYLVTLNDKGYDNVIKVKTTFNGIPASKLLISHEVSYEKIEIINKAKSSVAFAGIYSRKPMRASRFIADKIRLYARD